MNQRYLEILQHALGLDKYGQGSFYRNRFVTGPGSDDFEHCCDLAEAGYMARAKSDPGLIGETNELFYVTELGIEQVKFHSPKPPIKKLAWEVEVNGCVVITFAETLPKAKWNAVRGYREVYDSRRGVWPSVKAHRLPHLDNHSEGQTCGRKCFGYDSL